MGDAIEFVRNYDDNSTERGFQFEFYCDRCQGGFRTKFRPWITGTVTGVLDTASNLLGGILGRAAQVGDEVRTAKYRSALDEAYREAVDELKPSFFQCPRCSSWVCRKACLNDERGLCKNCAPDLGVEMAAAQASHSVEEIWAHARMADSDKKLAAEYWQDTIRATCPKCEAPLGENAKFCAECGAPTKQASFCTSCGAELAAGAKFCPECGQKA